MFKVGKDIGFLDYFDDLEDPRINRTKFYPLDEILFTVICATICGANSWRDFADFAETKLDYLRKFYHFENGAPSKNTFARVMSSINPIKFKECFLEWMRLVQIKAKDVIAIDGKALRHSFDNSKNQSPIFLVSAFASSLRLTLAQEKVFEKSNEITAIPKILEMLEIKGAIITIDAMGCQKGIAAKIREKEADYMFSLKGNHGKLHGNVKDIFESKNINDKTLFNSYEENDKKHGRIEKRKYYVTDNISDLPKKEDWKDLESIVMVQSTRETKKGITTEKRFYISSLPAEAKLVAETIRSHWAIENNLHWTLDVAFREDDSQIREKNAVENVALVRKIGLNLLQVVKKRFKDMSIPRLRKKAGWDHNTLEMVLMAQF